MTNRVRSMNRKVLFLALASIIVIANIVSLHWFGDQAGSFSETAILVDFALFIPFLYILYFRHDLKRALVKSLAIACLGFWGASILIPETQHNIIQEFGFIRYVGLGVLFLIEIKIAFLIWKAILSGKDQEAVVKEATESAEMPEWVARLMAWEASLWQKAARAVGLGKKRK